MPTAYFIGGAPRSGKSTAIQRLIELRPMLATSSDAIRDAIKGVLVEEENPALFKTARGKTDSKRNVQAMREHPETVLPHYLGEYEITWRSVLDFVNSTLDDGRDVVIEGVAILPHNLQKLNFEYKAVIIANLEDQTETMLVHARANSHDWLHKYDDEVIRAFGNFNMLQNKYYYDEAKSCGTPVVVIDNDDFMSSINKAVSTLLDS